MSRQSSSAALLCAGLAGLLCAGGGCARRGPAPAVGSLLPRPSDAAVVTRVGDAVTLTWVGEAGLVYEVIFKEGPGAGHRWKVLPGPGPRAGAGGPMTVNFRATPGTNYRYNVRAVRGAR